MASVKRDQELPARQMDHLLAKDEPPSDAGGASVVTYLRKSKIRCIAAE